LKFLILGSCNNKKGTKTTPEETISRLLKFVDEDSISTIYYSDKESVVSFYSKQDCVIKESYQKYRIFSEYNGISFPISLIGCPCTTDITDLMILNTYDIYFINNKLLLNKDTLYNQNELTSTMFEITSHRYFNSSICLFTLYVEDSIKMNDVIPVVNAITFGFMYSIYQKYISNGKFESMSPDGQNDCIKNDRLLFRIIPLSKKNNKYCDKCGC
jgi:hypothetical protein